METLNLSNVNAEFIKERKIKGEEQRHPSSETEARATFCPLSLQVLHLQFLKCSLLSL